MMLFFINDKDLSKCRYTSPYGARIHPIKKVPEGHRGIDIGMPIGTPLRSPLDGVVHQNRVNNGGPTQGFGYYIILYHPKEKLYTLYAHLKELPEYKVGVVVKQGQLIGFSGNTGMSDGPHTHHEIHEDGFLFTTQVKDKDTTVDPVKYYPGLNNYLKKNLAGFKLPVPKEEIELVNFKEKWQEDLFIKTLKDLGQRKVLNNVDDWIKKYQDGKLTTSELGLLALVVGDRD